MRRVSGPGIAALAACMAGVALAPRDASAFCGFYVSGAGGELYNDATMVVLMRDGTRTVLAMQNNYQGPPQDFAMVVPVPVILREADVKTLPEEVFARVDALAAPRLVEYWEQDPCRPEPSGYDFAGDDVEGEMLRPDGAEITSRRLGVTIEAKFAVGEYQILILGAKHSSGLERWLRQNGYQIPRGAAEVLRPYVAAGQKFFVAKVDITKVKRRPDGRVMLSPLRFHYDSESFSLPVRLGLLNAKGDQDLIVHVLAREARYELANYRNVAIPTNLEVSEATRARFGAFYAALFDRTLAGSPGAVVTEYAWSAGTCDPCPQEPLSLSELVTLGAAVLPGYAAALRDGQVASDLAYSLPGQFVLTRLHARYGRENLGEDLVFRAAPAIEGGREVGGPDGKPESGARAGSVNNFQARYIIRHKWAGPVSCAAPVFGVWGGPPDPALAARPAVARDLAFVPRDAPLPSLLVGGLPEAGGGMPSGPVTPAQPRPIAGEPAGCGRCDASDATSSTAALLGGALLGLLRRRRGGGR